jgi:predicted GH43/DUF377 family glycosyl hydrolase
MKSGSDGQNNSFHGTGMFDWQISNKMHKKFWDERHYDEEKYWGGFSREPVDQNHALPDWAIGPFEKHPGNPVFAPSASGWDRGHISGGVHNGSILVIDGTYYYIYRGEEPHPEIADPDTGWTFDYICDIGLALSSDGIHFTRDTAHSPFFRKGEDEKYSFEDVNLVKHDGLYYLFCNRWNWVKSYNTQDCGVWMAVSDDLVHWEKRSLVFANSAKIHRNACVLQNPHNEAVKINGRYVMYINNGLIAYSDDLEHWKSEQVEQEWPGGEGCFAVTDYSEKHKDNILLFTGGHHTGHFYAVGEVLFHCGRPSQPLEWLPRPVLKAEPQYPWENGLTAEEPHKPLTCWRDTVFFTGMTLHEGLWRMYYNASEYYTCLATAKPK